MKRAGLAGETRERGPPYSDEQPSYGRGQTFFVMVLGVVEQPVNRPITIWRFRICAAGIATTFPTVGKMASTTTKSFIFAPPIWLLDFSSGLIVASSVRTRPPTVAFLPIRLVRGSPRRSNGGAHRLATVLWGRLPLTQRQAPGRRHPSDAMSADIPHAIAARALAVGGRHGSSTTPFSSFVITSPGSLRWSSQIDAERRGDAASRWTDLYDPAKRSRYIAARRRSSAWPHTISRPCCRGQVGDSVAKPSKREPVGRGSHRRTCGLQPLPPPSLAYPPSLARLSA